MNYSDIQCDNNLIKDKCCKIKYSGFLFKNNSDSVTIIYGFGDGWNNTDAQEMTKTDDGFVANIKMLDYRTFNFCFRNSNFEWDNNYGQNFSLPILKEDISEDDSSINNISIINKSTVDEILDYLYDSEVEKVTSQTEDFNIESFANNSLENKIEDFEVSVDSNLPINLEETLVSSNENIVLNEYLSSVDKTEFSMDSLINEILSPINSSNIFEEQKNSEEYLKQEETVNDFENIDDASVDEKISSLLSDIYNNIEDVKNADTFNYTETVSPEETTNEILFADSEEDLENDNQVNIQIDTLIKKIYRNIEVSEPEVASDVVSDTVEPSLLDDIYAEAKSSSKSTALIVSPRALSKPYVIRKKIKLAFLKLLKLLPKGFEASDTNK